MFDIGFTELLVLTIVAMVVIGPERLPGTLRTIGKQVGRVKRFFTSIQTQIDQELKMEELNEQIMKETKGKAYPPNDRKPDQTTETPVESSTGTEQPTSSPAGNTDDNKKSE